MKNWMPNPEGVLVDFSLADKDSDWRDILPGRSFCQCCCCSDYFNSKTGFAKHLIRDEEGQVERCMTPNEMVSAGMVRNKNQLWITEPLDFLFYRTEKAENDAAETEDSNEFYE